MTGHSPTPHPNGFTTWLAPAKLNLFLHITGRRADGYHELQTIFQFIELFDEIAIRPTLDGVISRVGKNQDVPEADDLMVRAAHLLQQSQKTHFGAEISINKRIPMGGGLGGGSSNAATVLMALNQLWTLNLPKSELQSLGLTLGADIPVFIGGHAAWAEGVGEKLTGIDPKELWYLVINPRCHVPTEKIFTHPELTRDCRAMRIRASLSKDMRNVCQPVVCKLYPEIDECIRWLEQFSTVRLSGTGGCVFTSFTDQRAADAALRQVPAKWQGFVAKGINLHPFYQR